MATMNDIFKRGYPFSAATGEKTRANLEDLVTRAVLPSASQLVDQVTLETYEDVNLQDDDAANIYRLKVKAGGIGTAQLAANAVTAEKLTITAAYGPAISLSNITGSGGITGISDWSNMFDGDNETATAEGTIAANATGYFYIDLGAVKEGVIRLLVAGKGAASNGFTIFPTWAFDDVTMITGVSNRNAYWNCIGAVTTAYLIAGGLYRFWGRYVGVKIVSHTLTATNVKFYRFDVYGQ